MWQDSNLHGTASVIHGKPLCGIPWALVFINSTTHPAKGQGTTFFGRNLPRRKGDGIQWESVLEGDLLPRESGEINLDGR